MACAMGCVLSPLSRLGGSGEQALGAEAVTKFVCRGQVISEGRCEVGVLRLRRTIRERIFLLRSG
jgi:hypothetical protein